MLLWQLVCLPCELSEITAEAAFANPSTDSLQSAVVPQGEVMGVKRCLACGDPFPLRAQLPEQSYCSAPACQRQRRKLWQREKRQTDDDYRQNQARAQKKWLDGQPDYWKRYRAEHPGYTERNRENQRARSAGRRAGLLAKMDASKPSSALASGTYRLTAIRPPGVAKMDAWIVEITVLTTT